MKDLLSLVSSIFLSFVYFVSYITFIALISFIVIHLLSPPQCDSLYLPLSLSLSLLLSISISLSHTHLLSDISRSMIDAAKTIMEGVREKNGTDSVFYDKSGEVLKRADQKVRNTLFLYNKSYVRNRQIRKKMQ